jgi:hypothetical protein
LSDCAEFGSPVLLDSLAPAINWPAWRVNSSNVDASLDAVPGIVAPDAPGPPEAESKLLKSIPCDLFAIFYLPCQLRLQYHECVCLAGCKMRGIYLSEAPPERKVFNEGHALG